MIPRRLLLLSFVAMTACAVYTSNGDGWEEKPSHAPLPAYFVDVDGQSLQRICGPRANFTFHGCAFRNYAANRCTVYVEKNAPQWLAAHEVLHCSGFDHPQ